MNTFNIFLKQLEQSLHERQRPYELVFQILYCLAPDTQLEAAVHVLRRYLPILDRHRTGREWVKTLLDDPHRWFSQYGRRVDIEEPTSEWMADATFFFGLDALMVACAWPSITLGFTGACARAVVEGVGARIYNVFQADDPEAAEIRLDERYQNGEADEAVYRMAEERSHLKNVACLAVEAREWTEFMNWLQKEPRPLREFDPRQLEQDLRVWTFHGGIILPNSASAGSRS